MDVYSDNYVPTWYDAERTKRVVYAETRDGIAVRVYCSPENFRLMKRQRPSAGGLPDVGGG